ncbi:MAG: OmpH family outer membrane protein [Erythrobacter sp.]
MKLLTKTLAAVSIASAAIMAVPATAQVEGKIATVNAPLAIINTNAFKTAYQQIGTTYKPQIDTIQARSTERQALLQQLDTNGDKQLDEAEQQAAQGTQQATRLAAIEQEVGQLSGQVDLARVYAIEQILAQYGPSLQQVAQQLQVQMVVTPDAILYAPPAASITQQVSAALNTKVPAVQIVPPQGFNPRRDSVATYQQIQQALLTAQAIQRQQAAQQAATPAPAGR